MHGKNNRFNIPQLSRVSKIFICIFASYWNSKKNCKVEKFTYEDAMKSKLIWCFLPQYWEFNSFFSYFFRSWLSWDTYGFYRISLNSKKIHTNRADQKLSIKGHIVLNWVWMKNNRASSNSTSQPCPRLKRSSKKFFPWTSEIIPWTSDI